MQYNTIQYFIRRVGVGGGRMGGGGGRMGRGGGRMVSGMEQR